MHRIAVVVGAIAACQSMAAEAQYRAEVPGVLPPAAQPPSPHEVVGSAFRDSYIRRGSPRVALFWNRSFDDEVSSAYEDRTRITSRRTNTKTGFEEASQSDLGSVSNVEENEFESGTIDIVSGSKRAERARPSLVERSDWRLEQAFQRELAANGIRFVDRGLAMRKVALEATRVDVRNVQEVEATAVAASADLILEVLQTNDAGAAIGLSFRIDVKDFASSTVVASVISAGRPMSTGPGRFVATSRGFKREGPPPLSLEAVGKQLALETMAALADSWR